MRHPAPASALLHNRLVLVLIATLPFASGLHAADTTVQPAAGSGFVVKDGSGANERLRVQDSGAITLPALPNAATQAQALCIGAGGLLGPCATNSGSGGNNAPAYTAATGLNLNGTTFSVAPTFQLPQACAVSQIPQWNGNAWTCTTLPTSATPFALPFAGSAALPTTANTARNVFEVTNTGTGNAISGIAAGNAPPLGDAPVGVEGIASGALGIGVHGIGSAYGVMGEVNAAGATAVYATSADGTGLIAASESNGSAGKFVIRNAGNANAAIITSTVGAGDGIAASSDQGSAGRFQIVKPGNNAPALVVATQSAGRGAEITAATGTAAKFTSSSTASSMNDTVQIINTGSDGAAMFLSANGTAISARSNNAIAGYFFTGAGSTEPALAASKRGTGTALEVYHFGGGNLATFSNSTSNVARIDNTGKGFFNGGTATGGADLAEYVPISGAEPQPGDVVEIDPAQDDRFRLSTTPNNPRVAGVISTAPGVTLNDKIGATQAASGPALALAGRVPVKVTNESGAIARGDLLAASSTPGHAMRAPRDPELGTVIGKALQSFDDANGSITMLVWPH